MQGSSYFSVSPCRYLPLQKQLNGSWDVALHFETIPFFFLSKEGSLISSMFSGGGGKEWDINLELDRKTNVLGYSTTKAWCPKVSRLQGHRREQLPWEVAEPSLCPSQSCLAKLLKTSETAFLSFDPGRGRECRNAFIAISNASAHEDKRRDGAVLPQRLRGAGRSAGAGRLSPPRRSAFCYGRGTAAQNRPLDFKERRCRCSISEVFSLCFHLHRQPRRFWPRRQKQEVFSGWKISSLQQWLTGCMSPCIHLMICPDLPALPRAPQIPGAGECHPPGQWQVTDATAR